MNRKYTILSFLLLAGLLIVSQTTFLITVPEPSPQFSDWAYTYLWTSSIEVLITVVLLVLSAFALNKNQSQVTSWASLVLILFISWFYIGRELWSHFVVIPKIYYVTDLSIPPYFSFDRPWVAIPRLIWHLLIPIAVYLTFSLIVKREKSNKTLHPTPFGRG